MSCWKRGNSGECTSLLVGTRQVTVTSSTPMPRVAPALLFALLALAAGVALAGTTPEGKAYLEANKLKEGVLVTNSGLQ